MKILMVCDAFPPDFAPRMGYLCKYLKHAGHTVDVVHEEGTDQRFAFLCGYADHVLPVRFYHKKSRNGKRVEWVYTILRDILWHYKDKTLVQRVRQNPDWGGYDIVLCSTYRTFPLKAAHRLARIFGIPFVADLRDIIEQYPDNSYLLHHLPLGKSLSVCVENRVRHHLLRQRNKLIAKAAAVISVSPWHVALLQAFNPCSKLIYNGFDPEVFFPADTPDNCFRITYTGRIISLRIRNPDWLFEAVARLLKKGEVSASDFRLCFYVDVQGKGILTDLARRYGVEAVTECFDLLPADKVPALLNRSSVLLQLANKADDNGPKGIMTTKLFEAMAVGKPLLLVRSDESYLAETITRFRCGLAAQDVDSIEMFLKTQYQKWKQTGSTAIEVSPELEKAFSRKEQAGQFVALFKEILAAQNKKDARQS